ncbi:MAG: hypothetical protein J6333_12585 [Planctomycetes bacterium]|nr:hypothetical protein [Planctomycetota bacterium]
MEYVKLAKRMLLAGAVAVACTGCMSHEETKSQLDAAMDDELPTTLAKKKKDGKSLLAKAEEMEGNDIISSPLQKQLAQLKKEASEQRQALSQSKTKSEELERRSRELRSSLQNTEAKIAKVERVMKMINDNPESLEGAPLNAGSTLAMAGNTAGEGGNNGFNLNDEEMPSLGDAPDTTQVKSEWAMDGGDSSLAPAGDGFSAPALAEKAGDVWAPPAASTTPASDPVKVILCDGEGATANYIISRPAGATMEKGMLFKADDGNVLVVTEVYAVNAKARLHPSYAKGGVKEGQALAAITALP